MKTRIISGVVLITVATALVSFHLLVDFPYLLIGAVAFLAATATYEMAKNAKFVNHKILAWVSSVFAAVQVIGLTVYPSLSIYLAIIYVLIIAFFSLLLYGKISNSDVMSAIALPLILGFAFFCVYALLEKGLVYLLLLLNFSSVCDCGAYFVGVTSGRHKLCEKISPKKTIEGSVGGIVLSIIVSVLICFIFGMTNKLLPLIIITPVLCVVGMIGDLFASVIKRNADIKDYGTLIPGHGGITDRFDSILLIAPLFVLLLNIF